MSCLSLKLRRPREAWREIAKEISGEDAQSVNGKLAKREKQKNQDALDRFAWLKREAIPVRLPQMRTGQSREQDCTSPLTPVTRLRSFNSPRQVRGATPHSGEPHRWVQSSIKKVSRGSIAV